MTMLAHQVGTVADRRCHNVLVVNVPRTPQAPLGVILEEPRLADVAPRALPVTTEPFAVPAGFPTSHPDTVPPRADETAASAAYRARKRRHADMARGGLPQPGSFPASKLWHHLAGGGAAGKWARRGKSKRAQQPRETGPTRWHRARGGRRTLAGRAPRTRHAGPARWRRVWTAAGAFAWPHYGLPRQGGARGADSPSSLLTSSGDMSCIVLRCVGSLAVRGSSHKGSRARTSVSALIRTKGDDGGRHRRRRQVNRVFCPVPWAALLPESGDPIEDTFLGRQQWDTPLFGLVAIRSATGAVRGRPGFPGRREMRGGGKCRGPRGSRRRPPWVRCADPRG